MSLCHKLVHSFRVTCVRIQMKSPPTIFSLASLVLEGTLANCSLFNIPSIILRPDKYNNCKQSDITFCVLARVWVPKAQLHTTFCYFILRWMVSLSLNLLYYSVSFFLISSRVCIHILISGFLSCGFSPRLWCLILRIFYTLCSRRNSPIFGHLKCNS